MTAQKTDRRSWTLALLLVGALGITTASHAGIMLTDSAVFSTNGFGENWNGWIWNTQAPPDDGPNRWNMYYSSALDPQNPVFINAVNEPSQTNIDIDLGVGVHNFLIYGDTVTTALDPQQHFVLSLYFGGNQVAPDISGLYGAGCPTVCAASHWNGLDLYGTSGMQEAGTLLFTDGGYLLELTEFTWVVNEDIDLVWPHWDNTAPYSNGNDRPDFVGMITLRVSAVPEPTILALMSLGLAGIGYGRRKQIKAA